MRARAFRVVEGQHVVSTRRLVDSREEQELLEDLIEGSKPPFPDRDQVSGLHYLLSTPFRYPPLRYGSRFGTRVEPSLWYGSALPRTAFAEAAYYRLVFLEGTTAQLGAVRADFSIFEVRLRTRRGVDLTREPFALHRSSIASPSRYEDTQSLGREMREDGVECFRYPSARDRRGGVNLAAFTPKSSRRRSRERPRRGTRWPSVSRWSSSRKTCSMFGRSASPAATSRWAADFRHPRCSKDVAEPGLTPSR